MLLSRNQSHPESLGIIFIIGDYEFEVVKEWWIKYNQKLYELYIHPDDLLEIRRRMRISVIYRTFAWIQIFL